MTDKTPELSDASVLILLKEHARLKTECDRQRIAIEELKKEIESVKAKKKTDERRISRLIREDNEPLSREEAEDCDRSFDRLLEEIRKAEKCEDFERYHFEPCQQRNF